MMQKLLRMAAILLILAVAAVGTASAASDSTDKDKVITSTGTGNVIGTPDRAQVTFSVQTENTDVKQAQSENSVKMNSVIDALVAAGIPRDALKTTGYNIYPVYEESTGGILTPKIKTYQVTNTLTVTLHDVSKTGEVIDVAVANGINQATSIQFMLSDEQSQVLRTQALQKAVTRARSDADTVATTMGTTITGVKNADISQGYSPVLYQNYQYDAMGGAMKTAASTPVQSGDITVSATVTITYTIQ
ncbi:MAG: SIMPL domain-containing protein [Methanoregula sp.]|jgi:hypothetical protein|nr:SIMPL domain-containing protein [Methanoregula sp.]